MLSKENSKKLVLTGLYSHEPDKKYRGSLYENDLYWCFNWTFTIKHNEETNKWYMVDTYFGDKSIELTDDNFNEFNFLFDFNEVEKCCNSENISEYDKSDWWHVPVDSSGLLHGGKYFLRKGAKKSKEKVIERLEDEIKSLERKIKYKKETLERVKNDEINLDYV